MSNQKFVHISKLKRDGVLADIFLAVQEQLKKPEDGEKAHLHLSIPQTVDELVEQFNEGKQYDLITGLDESDGYHSLKLQRVRSAIADALNEKGMDFVAFR